jgi:hypothetical protein
MNENKKEIFLNDLKKHIDGVETSLELLRSLMHVVKKIPCHDLPRSPNGSDNRIL